MFENQEVLTRGQAATMLACSVDTIDRLASEGILKKRFLVPYADEKAHVLGRLPRILKSDVDELIAKRFKK